MEVASFVRNTNSYYLPPDVSGENIAPGYSFSAFAAMIAAALFVFAIFAPRPVSTSIHPQ
jgi:hypothetical protein